ncbi:MAG: LPS export ABC transporter permease LptF [Thiotrichales bacterium]
MSSTTLYRYLIKDVLVNFLAILLVLMLILLGGVFVRLLSRVVDGVIDADLLLPMLFWGTVESLSTLLVISLFLGMLLSLGRLYKDSEIYAIRAIGLGDIDLIRVYLVVGSFVAVVLFVLVAWLAPWSKTHIYELRQIAAQKFDLSGITPGQFIKLPGEDGVVFAESVDTDKGLLKNIYLFEDNSERTRLMTASQGKQTSGGIAESRYLDFFQGYIYEHDKNREQYAAGSFVESGLYLPGLVASQIQRNSTTKELPALWKGHNLTDSAELHWRLSFPVSMLVLTFLAVPLSYTTPRKGRFGKLAVAILIYILYSNLLGVGKIWIESGAIPAVLGLWWVHLLVLSLGIYLLYRQGQLNLAGKNRLGLVSLALPRLHQQ